MEDIDGGLHPAVDGQSLDEDDEERGTENEQKKQERRGKARVFLLSLPFKKIFIDTRMKVYCDRRKHRSTC